MSDTFVREPGVQAVTLSSGSVTLQVSSSAGSPLFITGSVGNTNLAAGLPSPLVPQPSTAPFVGVMQDSIGWTVSLTGSLSASNAQVLPLKSDYQGNLAAREQYAPVAEDNFNGVYAMTKLPTTASAYTWPVSATTAALVSGTVIKASPGVLRSISGRLDATAPTGGYFLQVLNQAGGTAQSGAITPLVSPQKLVHTAGTDNFFSYDFTSEGVFFSAGLGLQLSLTEFTYTSGSSPLAVLNHTTLYK